MLINNLEAFVQDPLVTWFKTGVSVNPKASSSSSKHRDNGDGHQHRSTQDNRIDPLNATHSATHVLSTIRKRLSGVYNYSIENAWSKSEKKVYLQKKLASSMRRRVRRLRLLSITSRCPCRARCNG